MPRCRVRSAVKRIAHRLFQIGDLHEAFQLRRRAREARRLQHVEMIVAEIEVVVAAPFQGIELFRPGRHLADLHRGLGLDAQFFMLAQQIEVIDRVAQVIGIGIELGARIGGDLEASARSAALPSAAACAAPSPTRGPEPE